MPEHSSFLTLILGYMKDTLSHNASALGKSVMEKHDPSWHGFEPLVAAFLVAAILIGIALVVKKQVANVDAAVVPDDKLTLRTFIETFLGYFYDLARNSMGPERAKKYFPIIGTSAMFVFFSNVMAMIPGMPVATSSLNVTLGCALVVFILFNIYGIQQNGLGYFKHMMGPSLVLAPLIFFIELISVCVRPVTLGVRLMLNMAMDHLLLGVFMGLVPLLVPLPIMMLGLIVVIVQTLVFTLLTTIYIALATEHEEHAEAH